MRQYSAKDSRFLQPLKIWREDAIISYLRVSLADTRPSIRQGRKGLNKKHLDKRDIKRYCNAVTSGSSLKWYCFIVCVGIAAPNHWGCHLYGILSWATRLSGALACGLRCRYFESSLPKPTLQDHVKHRPLALGQCGVCDVEPLSTPSQEPALV